MLLSHSAPTARCWALQDIMRHSPSPRKRRPNSMMRGRTHPLAGGLVADQFAGAEDVDQEDHLVVTEEDTGVIVTAGQGADMIARKTVKRRHLAPGIAISVMLVQQKETRGMKGVEVVSADAKKENAHEVDHDTTKIAVEDNVMVRNVVEDHAMMRIAGVNEEASARSAGNIARIVRSAVVEEGPMRSDVEVITGDQETINLTKSATKNVAH